MKRRSEHSDVHQQFTANDGTLAIPIAFGIATLVEVVAVHFLVPWLWLQIVLAVVSIGGALAFAGVLVVHRQHPHDLTAHTLTLRTSGKPVAIVPLDAIAGARIHRRYGAVAASIEKDRLFLPTQDGTSVDIDLREEVEVSVPALVKKWRVAGSVRGFSVQVDDPAALVSALTLHSHPAPPPVGGEPLTSSHSRVDPCSMTHPPKHP